MKICKICQLPQGKFNVKLDENGLCNYCSYWEKKKDFYLDYEHHQGVLKQKFDRIRGKYQYDALVGLSGGKDSTYVLFKMVREYNLKVLAVTYDNGFLSDFAKENIAKIVTALGVDHEYHTIDSCLQHEFHKASMKKFGTPCISCAVGGYSFAVKICFDKKIPFFVHGRTPYQMFRNFYPKSSDYSIPLLDINLEFETEKKLEKYYRKAIWISQLFLFFLIRNRKTRKDIYEASFKPENHTKNFMPEFLAYFLFEPYNEERMKSFLEKQNIGYRRPKGDSLMGHGDCIAHGAASFLYMKKNNISPVAAELAVMLRRNEITHDMAQHIMKINEPRDDHAMESLKKVSSLLSLDVPDLDEFVRKTKKFWGH